MSDEESYPGKCSFLVDAKYSWVRVLVPLLAVEHLEIFDKVLKRAWRFEGGGVEQ